MSELRRRNVLRMAVLYAVASWLILQVAEVLIGLAKLPDWIGTTTLWLLAIGFPIALLFSWFYEITPEGVSLEKEVDAEASITHVTGRRLDFIVISMLCAAVILFAYDKWWLPAPVERSVAVLPFVNMSAEEGNDYLADGLTEEIINELAHNAELLVTARTSAFAFKDQNMPIQEIAGTLGVAHVVEGSVQQSNGKLRITAQLVRASDGFHLWSESFDRDFDDIFAIQDEIANEVTSAFNLSVLNETTDRLKLEQTDNIDAYTEYLLAIDNLSPKTTESVQRAATHLQRAVELDPNYARAHAMLARVYMLMPGYRLRDRTEARSAARDAVSRALEIAPKSSTALAVLGSIERAEDNMETSGQLLQQAVEKGPNDVLALRYYATYLAFTARPVEAEAFFRRVLKLDPMDEENYWGLIYLLWGEQKVQEALQAIARLKEVIPDSMRALQWESLSHFLQGNYVGAIAAMCEAVTLDPDNPRHLVDVGVLYLLAGMPNETRRWFKRAAAIDPLYGTPLTLNAYLQENEEENALLAREFLADGVGTFFANIIITEYAANSGRHEFVLETLENLYPNLFDDPPTEYQAGDNATYFTGLALLQNGDIDRGTFLLKAYLKEQDKTDKAYVVHWSSITGLLALGETEAAMAKFREFASAKWYWAGIDFYVMANYSKLFDPIRDEPEFKALLKLHRENAAEQRRILEAGT